MRGKQPCWQILAAMLGFILVVNQAPKVTGQDAPQMQYGFVYHDTIGGEIHTYVAVLDTSHHWTITELPVPLASTHTPFGNMNPVWSSDGRRISGIGFESVPCVVNDFGDGTVASYGRVMYTFSYPDWQIEHTIEVIPPEILETCPNFEILRVQSVSPNGRYAWLTKMVDVNRATLVDLETGQILFQPTCRAVVIDWIENRAVIQNSNWSPNNNYINSNPIPLDCPAGLYTYDATTGEQVNLTPNPTGHYQHLIYAAARNLIVLSSDTFGQVGVFHLDGQEGFEIEPFSAEPILSPDERYLAYQTLVPLGNAVIRLDLETGQSETVLRDVRRAWWEGDIIQSEPMESYYPHHQLLGGASRPDWYATDDGSGHVTIFENEQAIWQSEIQFPNLYFRLVPVADYDGPRWGRYVWLTGGSLVMILDVTTLEILTCPQSRWGVANVSPDGAWLLCAPTNFDYTHDKGLYLYKPTTSEKIMLIQKELDYSASRVFPNPNFWWSPMFEHSE